MKKKMKQRKQKKIMAKENTKQKVEPTERTRQHKRALAMACVTFYRKTHFNAFLLYAWSKTG